MTIYHTVDPHANTCVPDPHQDVFSKNTLGFWIYLMTDCLLFSALFCTYAVLKNSTFGGPTSQDLFDLPLAFTETMALLCSSVACGLALLSARTKNPRRVIRWLILSFLLGSSFIAMELGEFTTLIREGHSYTQSAFLTAFFSLVGTHGFHVSVGLFWMAVMIGQLLYWGITPDTFRRLVIFSLFWHFLDLIWIFIFTFVYLIGVV